MNLGNRLLDNIKKPFSIWTSALRAARPVEYEPRRVVGDDVDRDEFESRYKNTRRTAIIAAVFWIYDFLCLITSSTLQEFFVCLLILVLIGMFYIRFSMIMWISRCCWNNWDKRNREVSVTGRDFFVVVMNAPREALPLKLEQVRNEKNN